MIIGTARTTPVYDAIVTLIADGELEPGTWLREAHLSARLGTSRTPVREALRSLAADGLVEIVRNRGARVRNWTNEQVTETYSLRAVLEGHGARLAASKTASTDMLERLREAQKQLEQAVNDKKPGYLDEIARCNAEFHGAVLDLANSPMLTSFVSTLSSVMLVRRAFRGYSPDDLARTITSHRDVLYAIETGNAALAEAAMQSHILAASRSAVHVLHRDLR